MVVVLMTAAFGGIANGRGYTVEYYLAALRKYAVFKGRASKMEYWMFALLNMLFGMAAFILDVVFRTSSPVQVDLINFLVPFPGKMSGFIGPLYFLAIFVPFLAVTVRRLHDTGGSGWWCLVAAIPLVGTIFLIVLLAIPGSREENVYGPAVAENIPVYKLPQQRMSD